MVQAIAKKQAVKDLTNTNTAEKPQAAKKRSRRNVQKGGVLCAH